VAAQLFFTVISVTRPAHGRAEQASKDRLGAGLGQRDRSARQARLGPPRLSDSRGWGVATPAPVLVTAAVV
jgi:hypothetical protein